MLMRRGSVRRLMPALMGVALILQIFLVAPALAEGADVARAQALAARWLAAGPEDIAEVYEELETFSPLEKNEVDRTIRRLAAFERGVLSGEGEYKAWLALEEIFLITEDMALKRHGKAIRDLSRGEIKALLVEAATIYPGVLDPSILSQAKDCGADDADEGPLPEPSDPAGGDPMTIAAPVAPDEGGRHRIGEE
jgi:hypothetical protein